MYIPSDDSFLLAECARNYRGRRALEIGVGSGVVTMALEENFEQVAGTDVDFDSLLYCKSRGSRAMLVCCDAASAFAQGPCSFDLIVANPPYLPGDPDADRAVHGGPSGIETTIRFVQSALPLLAEGGRVLVVVSSHANTAALGRLVGVMEPPPLSESGTKNALSARTIKEKKLFFETLSVVELSYSS